MPQVPVIFEESKIVERTVIVTTLEVIAAILDLFDRIRGEGLNSPINRIVRFVGIGINRRIRNTSAQCTQRHADAVEDIAPHHQEQTIHHQGACVVSSASAQMNSARGGAADADAERPTLGGLHGGCRSGVHEPPSGERSIVPAMASPASEAIFELRRHLNQSFFKVAPEAPPWRGRGAVGIVVAGLFLVAMALQLFRIGPGIALNSIWAEDGPIFLQGAIQHSFWSDLWATYAGYLVVVPRLIGLFAHLFPLRDAPAAISILSVFVVALSGLVVWFASAAHIRNPYLRGTLVALAVLTPTAALESVASGTYVSWFMLLPVFWLLIWRPRTTRGAILGGLFILMTSLSSPGMWFFAPLAALRAIAIRDRRDGILFGSWALGSVIQVFAYLLQSEKQVAPLWSHEIWTAYLQRVLAGAALGEHLGGRAWAVLGWPLLIALTALAMAGLYLGLRRANAAARWLALLAVPTSIVMFIVSVYQRAVGPQMVWPAGSHLGAGGRYTIVPALLLVSLALVLVDDIARRQRSLGPWLVGAVEVVLIAGMVFSFDVRDSVIRGTPSWSRSLDAADAKCRAESAAEVSLAISPPSFLSVTVPCDEVEPG